MATDAEASVDELLDAIEQGTLVLASGAAAAGAPDGALDTLFTSSDRLARDPDDAVGRDELRDLLPQRVADRAAVRRVDGHVGQDASTRRTALGALVDDADSSASDIIGAAQDLRSLVRQYV